MTSFEVPVDVDHSIQDFIASSKFVVKAGVIKGYAKPSREMKENMVRTNFGMSLAEFTKARRAGELEDDHGRHGDVVSLGNEIARILDRLTTSGSGAESASRVG